MSSAQNTGTDRVAPLVGLIALASLFLGAGTPVQAQTNVPPFVSAALANPARPDADRNVDALRKPGELIAFAGLKPGDSILELIPGGGYFTRIFSNIVGPKGQVYELVTAEEVKGSANAAAPIQAIAANPAFPRVTVLVQPVASLRPPAPVDMVWTSQNYHDLHDRGFGPADIGAFNKAVFAALKPGGVFMITDHAAADGSGLRDTQTLHRIDPAAVKAEVSAAGFILEAQSDLLRDPGDDHALHSSNAAIRGKTDKFVFRFRKPGPAH